MTGCGDLHAAMAAVNEGQICRFVTKPCEIAALRAAIEFAVNEYRTEMAGRSAIRRFAVRDALLETLADLSTAGTPAQGPVMVLYLLRVHFIPAFAEDGESADAELMIAEVAARLSMCATGARCLARWDAAACITIQAHAGIVIVRQDEAGPQGLMAHAELAAQRARGAGAVGAFVYTAKAGAEAEYHRELVRSLRRAIAEERLELHYQPIVDIESAQIHAIEALARWRHPLHGSIPPG